jgi:deoxyribonuclease V
LEEARRIQGILAAQLIPEGTLSGARYIAGCDVAYGAEDHWLVAGVVIWDMEKGRIVESRTVTAEVNFPYVPGYLSFRECPPLLEVLSKLGREVHAVLVDGHGIAHPRGLGLASHLGLHLDVPTVGCAKSLLAGEYEEPGPKRGNVGWIFLGGKVVGAALRTRDLVKPVFVSPGNNLGVKDSVELVLKCCRGYRIPEPIRCAHLLVQGKKREGNRRDCEPQMGPVEKNGLNP